MLLPFEDLKLHPFELSNINVILQNPQYRELNSRGRTCNGFIYIKEGSCRYEFEDGGFELCEGGLTYLPLKSYHKFTITSESILFYRVDFTLTVNGKPAYFSDRPLKICDQTPIECVEAIAALESDYSIGDNMIIKTEKMCTVFAALQRTTVDPLEQRLTPAVKYLHEHAADGVDCSALAELCFLSKSRFYDLFHKVNGLSPLEYRNQLLLKRAKALLMSGDVSVGETAFAVGFENLAYFSRFFKKRVGISPVEFLRQHTNNKKTE